MRKIFWIRHISVFLLAITLLSCSVRRKTKKVNCVSMNSGELIQKVSANSLSYDWFSSKLDVRFTNTKEEKQDFKASIRIRKDSAIWSSIKVMSIPVALTIVSQDSIKALIKQPKKQYLISDIDYLIKKFNVDADYFTLQNILSGQAILMDSSINYIAECRDNDLWLMTHTEKEANKALKKRQDDLDYIIKYKINKELFVVEEIIAQKVLDGSQLIVNYKQFESIEEQLIPSKTSAYFYSIKDSVKLDFSSSKIKLNKAYDMPFNVTDSYEQIILE